MLRRGCNGESRLRAIFAACATDENRAAGARDAAVLALLYGTGLRRAELALLDLEDFDADAGSLRVHGKGNKERIVFLPAGTIRALEHWLQHRRFDAGPLFCHVAKTGAVRISAQLVYRVVLERQRTAGVDGFTPHDLRRSFISDLLDEGVDLATVSRQVGHSDVQTTARTTGAPTAPPRTRRRGWTFRSNSNLYGRHFADQEEARRLACLTLNAHFVAKPDRNHNRPRGTLVGTPQAGEGDRASLHD